jgi:mono/diheme cytochrome c family protein
LIAASLALAAGCASRTPPQALSPPAGSAALAVPGASTVQAAPADSHRTILDGVYTEEQSRRGEAVYFTSCVLCHKQAMTGSQIVPPLVGEAFLSRWNRRTAGDLFEWMRTSMPPVVTSRLSHQEYADVLAFILSRNQFPAGREELVADFSALKVIHMTPSE